MHRKLFSGLLVAVVLFMQIIVVTAQDNLLNDPGFEGNYSGRGRADFNIPDAWGGWWTDQPRTEAWMNVEPIAFPHTGGFKRGGANSLNIGRGDGTFTAAAYQQVPNIPAGSPLRGSAWVYIENNDPNSNARVRIGIGSGTNPLGSVTWSGWMQSANSWQQISIDAVAPSSDVTLFIYATQDWPANPNGVYFDDASLVITGAATNTDTNSAPEDSGTTTESTTENTGTVVDSTVPFVSAQENVNEQGSIIHVVQSGDTLASISVAYGTSVRQLQELNGIDGSLLAIGQEIIVGILVDETSQGTEQTEDSTSNAEPAQPAVAPTATETMPTATQVPPTATQETVQEANPLAINKDREQTDDGNDGEVVITVPPPLLTFQAATQIAEGGVPATPVAQDSVPAEAEASTEEVATEEPTASPEPTLTEPPAATAIPETATEPPPAPVIGNKDVVAASDAVIRNETTICVIMFDDLDQNRIQQPGEALIAGGTATLIDADNNEIGSIDLSSVSDQPYCFEELELAEYTLHAAAPAGYGMTTPEQFQVTTATVPVTIQFGVAQGVTSVSPPTPDPTDEPEIQEVVPDAEDSSSTSSLIDMSGVIVLALAGVVLAGGAVITMMLRP